jgi:putative methionine-R-sulfoxide reductase with GAF domain
MPKGNMPVTETDEPRQVAIVGLNRETAALLPSLLEAEGSHVIKVINPDLEDLNRLTQYPHLSIIIDTTHSATVATKLKKLPLRKVEVISGLSARILYCSSRKNTVEEKDSVLRSLEEIRETVCLTKNKDEILKVILNTAVRSAGADCGSIMLLDPSKRHLTIEAAYGLKENVVASSIQRVGKGISGMAVRSGKPIMIQGTVDRIAYATDYQKPDIVSSICCPLLYGEEPVGVINISSKNPERVFTNSDEEFLVKLSQLTAEVIITSRDNASNLQSTYVLGLFHEVPVRRALEPAFDEDSQCF